MGSDASTCCELRPVPECKVGGAVGDGHGGGTAQLQGIWGTGAVTNVETRVTQSRQAHMLHVWCRWARLSARTSRLRTRDRAANQRVLTVCWLLDQSNE